LILGFGWKPSVTKQNLPFPGSLEVLAQQALAQQVLAQQVLAQTVSLPSEEEIENYTRIVVIMAPEQRALQEVLGVLAEGVRCSDVAQLRIGNDAYDAAQTYCNNFKSAITDNNLTTSRFNEIYNLLEDPSQENRELDAKIKQAIENHCNTNNFPNSPYCAQ
jgi:hypothetical protein